MGAWLGLLAVVAIEVMWMHHLKPIRQELSLNGQAAHTNGNTVLQTHQSLPPDSPTLGTELLFSPYRIMYSWTNTASS